MAWLINQVSYSGYYIGLGVEAAIALVAGVLLVLLLADVFVKTEEEAEEKTAATALVAQDQKDPWVVDEQQGEVVTGVPVQDTPQDDSVKQQPIIINVYNNGTAPAEEKKEEAPEEPKEEAPAKEEEDTSIKFSESKSIEELYDELSSEQKSFFDELKAKALAKPKAVLSVTRNYENVKIGKHSLIKLLIKKGVTVAEFLLESDLLKEYKKNSANKKGKSKIRIRPTVIAVTDLDSLKTALDMIDLAHEQMFDD